jgi:hypothetical protein
MKFVYFLMFSLFMAACANAEQVKLKYSCGEYEYDDTIVTPLSPMAAGRLYKLPGKNKYIRYIGETTHSTTGKSSHIGVSTFMLDGGITIYTNGGYIDVDGELYYFDHIKIGKFFSSCFIYILQKS